MRWYALGAGIFSAACTLVLVVLLQQMLLSPEDEISSHRDPSFAGISFASRTLLFAMFWPQCLLMVCVSAFCIVKAVIDWHGNTNRMLLLKLLDARQSQTPTPAKIA